MNETTQKIINCCDLPISIIIVGVGNADFSNMEILDGVKIFLIFNFQDNGMVDNLGRKAKRDLT